MNHRKDLFFVILMGLIAFVLLLYAQKADAAPWNNCDMQGGYTPPYYSVCNGYHQSCYLAFNNCTTVPDKPGTWNPRGYTPCQIQTGCN